MRKSLTILASAAQTEEGKNMNLGILGGGGKKSKRSAFLASLAAILLAAFGGTASAQNTVVPTADGAIHAITSNQAAAAVLGTDDGTDITIDYYKTAAPTDWTNDGTWRNFSALKLSNLVLNDGNTVAGVPAGAVLLQDTGSVTSTGFAGQTLTFGDIKVFDADNLTNDVPYAVGFGYNGDIQTATGAWNGSVTGGNVTVTHNTTAAGVVFIDTDNGVNPAGKTIAGSVKFGNITVNGVDGANGFRAGNLTGLAGGTANAKAASVILGDVSVRATNGAVVGVTLGNLDGVAGQGGTQLLPTFTVGKIDATSVNESNATGLSFGTGTLTLSQSVTATVGDAVNGNAAGQAVAVQMHGGTLVLQEGVNLIAKKIRGTAATATDRANTFSLAGPGTLVVQDKLFTNGGNAFSWNAGADTTDTALLTFNGDADLNKKFLNTTYPAGAIPVGRTVQTIGGAGGVTINAGVTDAAGNWTPNTKANIDLGWTDLSSQTNVTLRAAGDTVIRTHGDVQAGTLQVTGDYAVPAVPPAGWTVPAAVDGGRVELAGNVNATTTTIGHQALGTAGVASDSVTLAVSARDMLTAYNHNPQGLIGQDVSIPHDARTGIPAQGTLGNVTIGKGSTLEVWGNVAPTFAGNLGTVVADSQGTFVNMAGLTDWVLSDGTNGNIQLNALTGGVREKAFVNDGYLAALSIHGRYTAWNAVRDRFISGSRTGRFLGQAPCDPCAPCGEGECDPCEPVCETDCNPCDPCATGHHGLFGKGGHYVGKNVGRAFWVNYVGRADSYKSSYNGSQWKIGSDGVQVGADLYNSGRSQFGVLFGYEGGWANNAVQFYQTDTVKTDDAYVGFYAARVLRSGADVRATVNVGWQNHDTLRYDPRWNELRPYRASFDGNTVEANFELGKRLHNGAWSVRPVVAVDVAYNHLDSVQEDLFGLSSDALRYGAIDRTEVLLRFGSDLRFQRKRFTFNSGLYYSYDVNGQRAKTSVTADVDEAAATQTLISSTLYGGDFGRSILTFNVGGEYQFRCLTVFGGYQGQGVLDRDGGYQSVGYVGGAWHW